ncbi:MAG: 50S ribosomal protein L28 [Candidatus Omnitrophica bacterium]|nr:50S ribosomal protein L28 [Candidatus Omnitrophota bacterium]
MLRGRYVSRRGLSKKKGGTGSKITRSTKRKFYPNLRQIWIKLKDNRVKRVYVCIKCIKAGRAEYFYFKTPSYVSNHPSAQA